MRRYVVSEYGIRDYGIRDYGIRDYGLRDYGLRDTGLVIVKQLAGIFFLRFCRVCLPFLFLFPTPSVF